MISIAQILKPHGLLGEVKVQPLINFPERFTELEEVFLQLNSGENQTVHVLKARPTPKGLWLFKFVEFTSIEHVEALRNAYIKVPHESLFALPQGHYYVVDLVGCTVYLENKTKIGVVGDVLQTGANDVYVVRAENNKDILIPAIKDCIRAIDIANKCIIIRNLDGLLDLN